MSTEERRGIWRGCWWENRPGQGSTASLGGRVAQRSSMWTLGFKPQLHHWLDGRRSASHTFLSSTHKVIRLSNCR